MADGAPFQCTDAHQSCDDAGDAEKAEEELEVETPRETAPEAASTVIAEDLFTSAAFSSPSMPVTPPTVCKENVVPGTHCELQEALTCIRKIKRNLHYQKGRERAVPQHLARDTAHPHWLAFREEDPHNPAGPRPISSSDVLCILKHKDFTHAQRNVLLKYQ